MLQALKLVAFGAPALLCLNSTVLAEFIANPDFTQGDAEKGKQVYQRVGVCVNCHGWAGDGQAGRNPMAHAAAANLRETELDAQALYDTIRCGIPGTQMPYHDGVSYKDDRCYDLVMSDFDAGQAPVKGKTFREKQMIDLIAYLEEYIVGHGKPTYEECTHYYDTSAAKACSYLEDK
ncbi:MAG: c-type cytochrome [Devosia nanyangense]|uniref:C-type cytochrome n=1 Tax=Devosia nanyangense TaxID=1228055 RepID=A0A933L3D1_9HYPH|nr:c-type cytochrome [Devosia nanyangense]